MDEIPPYRPRANSYSGENASVASDASLVSYNGHPSNTRHSADVFNPMESNILKLNLAKVADQSDACLSISAACMLLISHAVLHLVSAA